MATEGVEYLSKLIDDYNSLKKSTQDQSEHIKKLNQKAEQLSFQSISLQNENQLLNQELARLKKENHYLNDQLNKSKELYSEAMKELESSYHFYQSINRERQIIEKLQEIFSVNSLEQLVLTGEKIKTVMLGVNQLEAFCRTICQIIYDEKEENYDLEGAVQLIHKLKLDSKYVECFVQFKQQLEQLLQLNNSTDQQILDKIKQETANQEVSKLKSLFKINGSDNFMFRMQQIYTLLQDLQNFIRIARRTLNIEEKNMRNEQFLMHILKILDDKNEDTQFEFR